MRAIWLLLVLVIVSRPASAQPAAPSAPTSLAGLSAEVDDAGRDLRAISAELRGRELDREAIQDRLADIQPVQAHLDEALGALAPLLANSEARLAQLGPAPGAAQPPEAPDIARTRRDTTRFHQAVDTAVKQARLLSVEADQLSTTLTRQRDQQFTAHLSSRGRSVLDPGLWIDFAASAPGDFARVAAIAADEFRSAARSGRTGWHFVLWMAAVVSGVVIAWPLRLLLTALGYARVARFTPSTRLRRSALALWLVLVGTATPLVGGLVVRAAFSATGALTPAAAELLGWLIASTTFAAFYESIGRALLAPSRESWRLAPLPDALVRRVALYPGLIGATAGLTAFARNAASILALSPATALAVESLTLALDLAAIVLALATAGHARSVHLSQTADEPPSGEAESRLPWIIVALFAWLAVLTAAAAMLTGYVTFAGFLLRNLASVSGVLATLFLLIRVCDDLFPALLSTSRPPGRFIHIAIGLSPEALEQLAVLISGVCRVGLLLLGWAAILAPFGDSAGDIFGRLAASRLELHVGQVSIAPTTVAGALVVFLAGLGVTRAVRGWLEARYLPKTRLDVGLRTSVSAGVTYLGALLALLLTCGYVGLSLDRIALFASALSVGIGFGLQSVIGNFVSGLILLAERPVKVGDWIAIGELEGDIRRINVRATEIEMQDRSKLIVPNSDLITKTVRNVTAGGQVLGRARIVLKVVDSADPAAVREIILARIAAHPEVLADPPAAVYLTDVRDGALEFTTFAYLATPRAVYRTRSELLFEIVPALRATGVQLASSTPVVNVGFADRPMEPRTSSD